jgi:prepilin-type N-terminal cleavage/methylation domain-containing protein
MLNKLSNRVKQQRGFTIIEVMIVLAIAGLIMVIVLIAVPQLQRSQRNSAATSALDRTFTEIQNYATNNNGKNPATAGELDIFCTRYLEKTGAICANETGAAFINDPRTGTPMRLAYLGAVGAAATLPVNGNSRTITVYSLGTASTTGFKCSGESVVAGTGARQIAAVIPLEGGAYACRDNQ